MATNQRSCHILCAHRGDVSLHSGAAWFCCVTGKDSRRLLRMYLVLMLLLLMRTLLLLFSFHSGGDLAAHLAGLLGTMRVATSSSFCAPGN